MPAIRHFIVPGRPKPKQRPRLFKNKVITPQQTLEYEARLREHYLQYHEGKEPLEGDLAVDLYAIFKNNVHPDLDNVIKILDGLNKVGWQDDKQIKEIHAYLLVDKRLDEQLVVSFRTVSKSFKDKVIERVRKIISTLSEKN